jgi:hypothetical protein
LKIIELAPYLSRIRYWSLQEYYDLSQKFI